MGLFKKKTLSTNDIDRETKLHRLNSAKHESNANRNKSMFWSGLIMTAGLCLGFFLFSSETKTDTECAGSVCHTNLSSKLSESGVNGTAKSESNYFVIEYKEGFSIDSAERFANKLDSIMYKIKKGDTVHLNVESGGGSSVSCAASFDYILRMKKLGATIVTSTDYIAASCGYMMMSTGDTVYANSGAVVGNIGSVYITRDNVFDALTKHWGGESKTIGSTRIKELLAGDAPKTESDVEFLRSKAKRSYLQFAGRVIRQRGDKITNRSLALNGDAYSGEEALKLGLIDSINNTRSLVRLAVISGQNVVLVSDNIKKTPIQKMMSFIKESESEVGESFM